MTGVMYSPVMAPLLLLDSREDDRIVVARRARLRDRLAARLRTFALDRALADGVPPERTAALSLRAQRLVGCPMRRSLAATIQRVVRHPRRRGLLGARVPVSPRAATNAGLELDELAWRLMRDAPVDARGVARARVLVSDGCGPLFRRDGAEDLSASVQDAIAALDPRLPPDTPG